MSEVRYRSPNKTLAQLRRWSWLKKRRLTTSNCSIYLGDFYPGVFQFMWELSLHPVTINQRHYDDHFYDKDSAFSLQLSPPKVAVLTARAEEFKAALEIKDGSKLAKAFR